VPGSRLFPAYQHTTEFEDTLLSSLGTELVELYNFHELLFMIALRDIKVRYKQSVMGFLWAILMPVLIVCAGILVRYAYSVASHKPLDIVDVTMVATKSIPWAFVVSSIRFASNSLTNNYGLVTKVYFPKEIFPIAAVLSQLFDLCIASSVLVILLVLAKVGLSLQLLWVVPLLIMLTLLSVGIGFLVSAGSLFFRDVKYVVEVFLTFAIFFTPVFYDVSMFGPRGQWLLLNPIGPILEGLNDCIVHHRTPNLPWLAYSFAFTSAATLGGYVFFKHLEPAFAENI
jgi:lipopolysaccharide transport system permease protein